MNMFKIFLLFVLSVILPPLAVALKVGLTRTFLVNIVLTLLGVLPGIVHAWWVLSRPEEITHPYMKRAGDSGERPSVWQYMA